MHRLRDDDRGAVAVMVALLIVPLIGFAAIAIDIAAIHSERQQLQTGADAAALAIAQDCAQNDCRNPAQTAQEYVTDNSHDDEATATVPSSPTPDSGVVTVESTGVTDHWFAPVLGISETDIGASATVAWGAPSGGTAVLPLTFSLCDFNAQTSNGTPSGTQIQTIYFSKSANTGCTNNSGNHVPGGFGWVKTNGNSCHATSAIGERLSSSPGNSVPNGCGESEIRASLGETVLLPIFDDHGGQGNNAWYRVHGYAAFHITGYRFSGNHNSASCSGSERCIEGYFLNFVDASGEYDWSPTAPRLGASVVSLVS